MGNVGFTLLPALTRRCRGVQQDLTPEPSHGPVCLGPALLSCSPALLWLQTLRATNSCSLHCSSCPHCSCKGRERGSSEPRSPEPQSCPRVCPPSSVQQQPAGRSQEERSVPEISRQFSSSNLQASVRVRKRQPMGFRGWPTQPSKLVMVVAPRCSSSAKHGTERL